MPLLYRRDQLILFAGDLAAFVVGLWLALFARHFEFPTAALFAEHLAPFAILFVLWLIVFVAVGLYDRHVALFEHRLPATITEAQLVNCLIAIAFFFFAPIAIQPKTILALYFVISTALIVVWRLGLFRFERARRGAMDAVLIGSGPDCATLYEALCKTPTAGLNCAQYIDAEGCMPEELERRVHDALRTYNPSVIIVDPRIPGVATHAHDVDIVSAADLYEALFSRVGLTFIAADTFVDSAMRRESRLYDALKRAMDIAIATVLGAASLIVYPIVYVAIKLDDGGPLFVSQERVGRLGKPFIMHKFRSMSGNDSGEYGAEGRTKLQVTRVGRLLRTTRIDELPQLWSVFRGNQSLVGPRPELPPLVALYRTEVPHYDLRHLVQPGLSGWAQVYHQAHPHHGAAIQETAEKLSYDLYYIKNRSLVLDFDIALKTMKTLILRVGA